MGDILNTCIDGDGFGFDEVTLRDVRCLEQGKTVDNNWAKGAKALSGASSFQYHPNGNLALLDRERKTDANKNSVAVFEYDLQGQIIGRAGPRAACGGPVHGATDCADLTRLFGGRAGIAISRRHEGRSACSFPTASCVRCPAPARPVRHAR